MDTYLKISGANIGSSKAAGHLTDIVLTSYSTQSHGSISSGVGGSARRNPYLFDELAVTMDINIESRAAFFLMESMLKGSWFDEAILTQAISENNGKIKRSLAITMSTVMVATYSLVKDSARMTFDFQKVSWIYR